MIVSCRKMRPTVQDPVLNLDRWNEGLLPVIPQDKWRKNGQWIELIREHAELIAQDFLVATKFEEHFPMEGGVLPLPISIEQSWCRDRCKPDPSLRCKTPHQNHVPSHQPSRQLTFCQRLPSQGGKFGLKIVTSNIHCITCLLQCRFEEVLYPVPASTPFLLCKAASLLALSLASHAPPGPISLEV